jgi:hypothetical protein
LFKSIAHAERICLGEVAKILEVVAGLSKKIPPHHPSFEKRWGIIFVVPGTIGRLLSLTEGIDTDGQAPVKAEARGSGAPPSGADGCISGYVRPRTAAFSRFRIQRMPAQAG